MHIQYLRYEEIDFKKWDDCIDRAKNGLIYGYSWYLNGLCKQWDALIMGDYKAVMPLPWRRKWSVCYLYQPYFCASLGMFSSIPLTANLINDFLKAIPSKFKYWDICLNSGNIPDGLVFSTRIRNNYTLSLENDYDSIFQHYRSHIKRNLKKASNEHFALCDKTKAYEAIELAMPTMHRHASITQQDWDGFLNVVTEAKKRNACEIWGVRLKGETLLASAIFFYSHQRWYYILAGTRPNGKTLGASTYLMDQFIAKHAGSKALLDFEGSDAPSVAFFYSSFGATVEQYPALKLNRLPWPLKWLK